MQNLEGFDSIRQDSLCQNIVNISHALELKSLSHVKLYCTTANGTQTYLVKAHGRRAIYAMQNNLMEAIKNNTLMSIMSSCVQQ